MEGRRTAAGREALGRFLKRLMERSVLEDAEQSEILSLPGTVRVFRTNHDIVSPKRLVDHACLIVDGLAARYDQLGRGRRQINAVYLPGDMGDLHSVVAPRAEWGIVALTQTTVLQIPHSELRNLAINFPAMGLAFWRDGTADSSTLAKWVANARRDARTRLAHLLCEIGVRSEKAGLGDRRRFSFPVSQHQLADAVGITAVHLNRTLQRLRSEGAIRTEGSMFIIEDWDRLQSIAQFDEGYLLIGLARPED